MAVPATNGQLRTKLSDMLIGDYIVCNYVAGTSGALGTFSNLGGTAGTEIPVAGSATPNGTFYFLKVDRGLLIADRIIQQSISWDTLNTGKVIQGKPLNLGTNLALGKTVTGTGAWSSSSPASIVTDGATTGYYVSNTNTSVVGTIVSDFSVVVDLGSVQSVGDIRALLRTDLDTQWNTSADIFYSTDNVTFTKFGTVTNLGQPVGKTVAADKVVSGVVSARYIKVTNFVLNSSYTRGTINELEVYTNAGGIIRSLSGGVAYADANGNSSTADASKGGWPTSNEWDKYIVNSNLGGKITAGNDSVWHWNVPVYNWPRNTIAMPPGTLSTQRTVRGYNSVNALTWAASNTATAVYGFRPVFDYKE